MISKASGEGGGLGIEADDSTGIAKGAEVFGREETESAGLTKASHSGGCCRGRA